jgi:hypothetical protein
MKEDEQLAKGGALIYEEFESMIGPIPSGARTFNPKSEV